MKTISLLSPGDMGSNIAGFLIDAGYEVISPLDERSESTKQRANKIGIENCHTLENAINNSQLLISILVPSEALGLSEKLAKLDSKTKNSILFADLNAIAPNTTIKMENNLKNTKIDFVDGGIIGGPPKDTNFPRVYISGSNSNKLAELNNKGMEIIDMGGNIGDASAIKMAYASITKGYSSLLLGAMFLAIKSNNYDLLIKEIESSQPNVFKDLNNLNSIPSKAHRWIGEMYEISKTYEGYELSGSFHEAAATIYEEVSNSLIGKSRTSGNQINFKGKEFFEKLMRG